MCHCVIPRFERIIEQERNRGSRLSKVQLLESTVNDYNQSPHQRFRIGHDEQTVLKFLVVRSALFRKRLTVIWGQDKPDNTAVPMNLMANPALQDASPQPVSNTQMFISSNLIASFLK